jgi:uracil-DNA glycosylase
LSVRAGAPLSHAHLGWERFTDRIIQVLHEKREHIVFLLWGSSAQKKGAIIDRQRHCVLSAPHPSPLSAYRGFFGCRHFSKANGYLRENGGQEIDWRLD